MTIYGVSQSSGVERRLTLARGEGVVLIITDHAGGKERERLMVSSDDLLAAITEPPVGGTTVAGVSVPPGKRMLLDLEVRRNEVLLKARPETGEGTDVAVGLDDLQDALEGVLSRG